MNDEVRVLRQASVTVARWSEVFFIGIRGERKMMQFTSALRTIVLIAIVAFAMPSAWAANGKPNILIIWGDDIGE
jgi:hypothetical protein